MTGAEDRAALAARLNAAIEELLCEHQPEWASPAAKEAGKDPVWCVRCGTADGSWPCVTRIVIDDDLVPLAAALLGGETER